MLLFESNNPTTRSTAVTKPNNPAHKSIGKLKFTVELPSIASVNVNITAKRLRITLYFIAFYSNFYIANAST